MGSAEIIYNQKVRLFCSVSQGEKKTWFLKEIILPSNDMTLKQKIVFLKKRIKKMEQAINKKISGNAELIIIEIQEIKYESDLEIDGFKLYGIYNKKIENEELTSVLIPE